MLHEGRSDLTPDMHALGLGRLEQRVPALRVRTKSYCSCPTCRNACTAPMGRATLRRRALTTRLSQTELGLLKELLIDIVGADRAKRGSIYLRLEGEIALLPQLVHESARLLLQLRRSRPDSAG